MSSTTNVSGDDGSCSFHLTGVGTSFDLPPGVRKTAGSGLHNDIVVNSGSEGWAILMENTGGEVLITSLTGQVFFGDRMLLKDEQVSVTETSGLRVGSTQFSVQVSKLVESPAPGPESDRLDLEEKSEATAQQRPRVLIPPRFNTGNTRSVMKHALFGLSALCIGLGTLAAIYAVTGSLFMVSADTKSGPDQFIEKLQEGKFKSLEYTSLDDNKTIIVSGAVDTRESKSELLEMARQTGTNVEWDLQLNSELIETVEDIYRVNGISAKAAVLGRGKLKVNTRTNDLEKLELVGLTVRADMPGLTDLEIINVQPGVALEDVPAYKPDPDKRITLISEGSKAYIMTQDKSRYFIGALLPSGHLVERIANGEIIVSKDGKQETMKF